MVGLNMGAFHPRFVRRQGLLGGLVGGILGGGDGASSTSTSASASGTAINAGNDPLGLGGIVGGLTSIINGIPTIIAPPSTGSTTSSHPASTTSTTSSSTSSTSTSSASPTSSDVIMTSSSGQNVVYYTSVENASTSPTASPPKGFLENKPLEGGVFALIGIVAMVIIFIAITFTLRRRNRNRLDREIADAVTFDPSTTDRYEDEERRLNSIEKRFSGSSSGHGHGYGYGPQTTYAPQQGYYGQGYPQQPAPFRAPSPYRSPSPPDAMYYNGNTGAGLTRKYSDRKPVPPLLPNPVYDPSRSQPAFPQYGQFPGQDNALPPLPGRSVSPAAMYPNPAPALPDTFGEPNPAHLTVANR
ncbi:hypothetical protein BJ138DRAFT_599421 [Hygrophoropsis aurantiaca]|uniref:Uncharacterized protein n=1 Tax=Hygrophoropsis aurantiaca TaxID=72124 RepID=A0ACB8ASL0_9AGAM|nr:hypothetical protein BJ138DRAFT_599421 [Hygrophoropsis aurantiaca]